MRSKLLWAAFFFAAASHSFAQIPQSDPGEIEIKPTVNDPVNEVIDKRADAKEGEHSLIDVRESDKNGKTVAGVLPPVDYIRPDAEKRFRNYLNSLADPVALAYYTTTAGLLTLRNSPKEWGDRSDGLARRFANVAGKNAVRSTTIYALDEMLKVDSSFYLSRDRRVMARLRNSVFSAVTARDRKGKRVIGIPSIAGGMLSEVVSSSGWYPPRYDYVHGLKGGAISIGITTGMNLLREFVWKPKR